MSLNMESELHQNRGILASLGSSKFTICVSPRASHTKLEKIMKELDEEVKFQDRFFTLFCIILKYAINDFIIT